MRTISERSRHQGCALGLQQLSLAREGDKNMGGEHRMLLCFFGNSQRSWLGSSGCGKLSNRNSQGKKGLACLTVSEGAIHAQWLRIFGETVSRL